MTSRKILKHIYGRLLIILMRFGKSMHTQREKDECLGGGGYYGGWRVRNDTKTGT